MSNFNQILGPDYAFLDTTPHLADNIHLLVYGGSKAYGTNLPTSDTDIRGIATNPPVNILTYNDFDTFTHPGTDTVIYSLDKILYLLADCNPNTIEILFTRDEDILYIDDIGKLLRANRNIFLSKKCIHTFGGYANQQLYRLRQKSLSALPPEEYNEHIAKTISGMKQHLLQRYGIDTINIINTPQGLVADIARTRCPAENISNILNEINNTIRAYNKNSQRNKKALEHGKINKHAMHLLRLYKMATELLLTGTTCTYRQKEHNLLMDVRCGKYSLPNGELSPQFFQLVKDEEQRFADAQASSVLPDLPDYQQIKKLQADINLISLQNSFNH